MKFIESLKRKRLTQRARIEASANVGVFAINNKKPLVNRSRQALVGSPGLFDADLQVKLTEEDHFLDPMKKATINTDIFSFSKLGAYMAQFWSKAADANNYVSVNNKLAIPEQLQSAILAHLNRSHPGQEAMVTASEYIWRPFFNRHKIRTCEDCKECTLLVRIQYQP